MNAGKYNSIVKLLEYKSIKNEYGEIEKQLVTKNEVRCFVEFNETSRSVDDSIYFDSQLKFYVRLHTAVDTNMIIEYRGEQYRITSVEEMKLKQTKRLVTIKIQE